MKAIAKQIDNNKEQISLNGKVILKSVDAGKWNYIIIEKYMDKERVGKSRDLKNALRWESGGYKTYCRYKKQAPEVSREILEVERS